MISQGKAARWCRIFGATVKNVNATVTRLNEQALSADNMQNVKTSMEHLNQATSALAESSKKIDGVVDKAGQTMTSSKEAADDLQKAIADARKTVQAVTQVMNEATRRQGDARDPSDEPTAGERSRSVDQQPASPRRAFLSR